MAVTEVEDREEPLRWRVNPGLRVLEHGDSLLLRTGDRVVKVSASNLVPAVRSLLESAKNGVIDLGRAQGLSPEESVRVHAVLRRLTEAGLLNADTDEERVRADHADTVDGLWLRSDRDVPRSEISRRLLETRVGVIGAGALANRIAELLRECGATGTRPYPGVADAEGGLDTAVVVGQGEEDPVFDEWNDKALKEGGPPWLAVMPLDGRRLVVGPWVFPHSSACLHCFRLRRASAFLDEHVGPMLAEAEPVVAEEDTSGLHPALTAMQAGLAADLVLQHVGLAGSFGQARPGGVTTVEYELFGVRVDNHSVLRVPRCAKCSPAEGGGYPQVWFHRQVRTEGGE